MRFSLPERKALRWFVLASRPSQPICPIILAGDFNAAAGQNKAYTILTADNFLQDTWIKAPIREGEGFGTFNGFKSMPVSGERIDWILTRGDVKVEAATILTH